MKILILNWRDRLNPRAGGGDRVIHRIGEYLVATGHEVDMVTSKFRGANTHEVIGTIRVHRVGGEIGSHLSVFIGASFEGIGDHDIIWDVINLLPWIRAKDNHDGDRLRAMMHQFTYQALRFEINPFLASVGRIVERRVTPRIYQGIPLVVPAESTREECIQLGFDPRYLTSIPPGIDFGAYSGNPTRNSDPRILFVGRLSRYKGVQHLLRAMPLILRRFPNATIDIVGRGYYAPTLIQLATHLGLIQNVHFHGFVDEHTKQNLIRRAWMLVLPSVQEGWGIPVMEAAAAGVPAVGTDTTGLRDSIIHGSTGLLVPFGDARAIADTVIRLIKDSELRMALGQRARQRARNFDWSLQLPKYASFLLDEWRPSAA